MSSLSKFNVAHHKLKIFIPIIQLSFTVFNSFNLVCWFNCSLAEPLEKRFSKTLQYLCPEVPKEKKNLAERFQI